MQTTVSATEYAALLDLATQHLQADPQNYAALYAWLSSRSIYAPARSYKLRGLGPHASSYAQLVTLLERRLDGLAYNAPEFHTIYNAWRKLSAAA